MQYYDCIVIGGGIVGLSVARAVLEKTPGIRLAVFEKETAWAVHQTGRNSGVIHSGIYYKPGSLKAELCRVGNLRLREFCEMHEIRYELCGKLIVATEALELSRLQGLLERGLSNGLAVEMLSQEGVREVEPQVRCLAGLKVPSTGIVSYGDVCRKLVKLISEKGGEPRLGVAVSSVRVVGGEAVVETESGDFGAGWVVNCAGLHSDRVAKRAGADVEAQIVPFRGEYYELKPDRRWLVRHLIYPVPDPRFPFLGVHFTRMIDGSVHAGPNAVLSLKREGYSRTSFEFRDFFETMTYPGFWRFAARHAGTGMEEVIRSFSKKLFTRSLQRLIPEVREEDLVPCGAGVRAQALRRDGSFVDDFLIIDGDRMTHVCNAPSPAATASLEIGRVIAERITKIHSNKN
jgi:(S)-2-hydroxyglutarate dehydrogenase